MQCRSKSVQTVFLISILVSHQRFYTRWYSNNQFLTVSYLLWFCPDRDHRKGVIKIIFLSRHGRMWACARGERRSREKWGRNPILSSFFVPFRSPRVALRKKRRPLAVYVKINRRIPLFSMLLFCGYHSITTLLWIVFVLRSPPTKLVRDRTNFPERKLTECYC